MATARIDEKPLKYDMMSLFKGKLRNSGSDGDAEDETYPPIHPTSCPQDYDVLQSRMNKVTRQWILYSGKRKGNY